MEGLLPFLLCNRRKVGLLLPPLSVYFSIQNNGLFGISWTLEFDGSHYLEASSTKMVSGLLQGSMSLRVLIFH